LKKNKEDFLSKKPILQYAKSGQTEDKLGITQMCAVKQNIHTFLGEVYIIQNKAGKMPATSV